MKVSPRGLIADGKHLQNVLVAPKLIIPYLEKQVKLRLRGRENLERWHLKKEITGNE